MKQRNARCTLLRTLALLAALGAYQCASASIVPGGRGVLFGSNHAFAVTAPSGWVLDNESAVSQGLFMTFYPAGFKWDDSPVIAYGRVGQGTAAEQVAKTVEEFHANNSPDYRAQAGTPLKLRDGKTAQVYFFEGDQWGNHEAGVYFSEETTLNFLIYSARDKRSFQQYWPQFLRLAQSYENVYAHIHALSGTQFDAQRKAADKVAKTKSGGKYEADDIETIGPTISNDVAVCAGFIGDTAMQNFRMLVQVMPDGSGNDIYVSPRNASAICMASRLLTVRHLRHHFKPYYPLVIDMKFKQ